MTTIRIAGGAAFSLCRAQRTRSRQRRNLMKSVSGNRKALCLVPAEEPHRCCFAAGLNRGKISGP